MTHNPVETAITDDKYLQIILNRLSTCKQYKPAFGQGQQVTLTEFQQLYGSDPFYTWFGLDNESVYAAHRAAGGMTSIYRQIGLGCEELYRQILQDQLGLNAEQVKWSYTTQSSSGQKHRLSLDGCLRLADIAETAQRQKINNWLIEAAHKLGVTPEISLALKGIVFEIRQGYKSKDSKRQNADIANATIAYTRGYLPVLLVLSTQIDQDIVERYEQAQWLILQGHLADTSFHSTYIFTKEVIGYDLASFFERHVSMLRQTITEILQILLQEGFHDD